MTNDNKMCVFFHYDMTDMSSFFLNFKIFFVERSSFIHFAELKNVQNSIPADVIWRLKEFHGWSLM